MSKLQKMAEGQYSTLLRVAFGLESPSTPLALENEETRTGRIEWINPDLNDSQKHAVKFALASKEIALIHGPPGVGSLIA